MRSIILLVTFIHLLNSSYSQEMVINAILGEDNGHIPNQITGKIDTSIKNNNSNVSKDVKENKPELFNSGFIDFQNNGQLNASARIFKIYIGEPKKFVMPISIYSGVSGNNANNGSLSLKGSEQMVLGLINPMSGLFNISTDNSFSLKKKQSLTKFSFHLQIGQKMISGQMANSLKAFNFFSSFSNSGLLFQTGAWEKDKEKNMGIFWIIIRFHLIQTSKSFKQLSGYPPERRIFIGYSMGTGIEINNVLNIKLYYYKYLSPGSQIFDMPIYQLSFNYNLKK